MNFQNYSYDINAYRGNLKYSFLVSHFLQPILNFHSNEVVSGEAFKSFNGHQSLPMVCSA